MVWLVSLVQLGGVKHCSTFQLIATILKVVLIVAFLVAGFVIGTPQPISFAPSASDFTHIISAPFAISLVFVMYSFSGWNAATYIIGEMHDAASATCRARCWSGTLIVLVLYVALNAVFLHTAPIDQLAGQLDVARIAGSHIFGEFGGRIVGAHDLLRADLLDQRDDVDRAARDDDDGRGHSGAAAVRAQVDQRRAGLCHPVSARGRQPDAVHAQFRGRARIHPVRLLFCSFFTVLGVIKLRITQPDLPRPYRAWGYPVTPLVFLLVTGFMMYYLLTERRCSRFLGI